MCISNVTALVYNLYYPLNFTPIMEITLSNPLLFLLNKCLSPFGIVKPKKQLYFFGLAMYDIIAGFNIWNGEYEFYWKLIALFVLLLASLFDVVIVMEGKNKEDEIRRNYSIGSLLALITILKFSKFQVFCYCLFVLTHVSKGRVNPLLWILAELFSYFYL